MDLGGVQRHSVELHLKSDLTIRKAALREESWVGESYAALTMTDNLAYHHKRIDEDGHEWEEDLGNKPLLPDPTLGLSVVPLLVRHVRNQDDR